MRAVLEAFPWLRLQLHRYYWVRVHDCWHACLSARWTEVLSLVPCSKIPLTSLLWKHTQVGAWIFLKVWWIGVVVSKLIAAYITLPHHYQVSVSLLYYAEGFNPLKMAVLRPGLRYHRMLHFIMPLYHSVSLNLMELQQLHIKSCDRFENFFSLSSCRKCFSCSRECCLEWNQRECAVGRL